jgi:hypothetical protein
VSSILLKFEKEFKMKLQEIKAIAKSKGVKQGNMKKPELIRAIQHAEGNFGCYGSATSGYCDQINCLWHEDCLQFSTNK